MTPWTWGILDFRSIKVSRMHAFASQGDALDDQYIIHWLKQFEAALDDSTLIDTYKRMRAEK